MVATLKRFLEGWGWKVGLYWVNEHNAATRAAIKVPLIETDISISSIAVKGTE